VAVNIDELRKIQHKPYEDLYLRFFRKFSIYLTWLLLHTKITANQVTTLSIIVGIVGTLFFVSANPVYWIFGYIVLQLSLLLDVSDGEVARYRKNVSGFGNYLDDLNHVIASSFLFITMTFGFYEAFNNVLIFVFGFAAVFGVLLLRVHNTSVLQLLNLKASPDEKLKAETTRNIFKKVYKFFTKGFGAIFHLLFLASVLDLILIIFGLGNIAIFRLIYLIASGVIFPLIFIRRLHNFHKYLSKRTK